MRYHSLTSIRESLIMSSSELETLKSKGEGGEGAWMSPKPEASGSSLSMSWSELNPKSDKESGETGPEVTW